jgi:hypothetical protein
MQWTRTLPCFFLIIGMNMISFAHFWYPD